MSDDVERRHRALIDRDQYVGLQAEADAARAATARLRERMVVIEGRLARKNARIKQLVARVDELEAERPAPAETSSWRRVGRLAGAAFRRGRSVDEV